jgi:hypothetical protein
VSRYRPGHRENTHPLPELSTIRDALQFMTQ